MEKRIGKQGTRPDYRSCHDVLSCRVSYGRNTVRMRACKGIGGTLATSPFVWKEGKSRRDVFDVDPVLNILLKRREEL